MQVEQWYKSGPSSLTVRKGALTRVLAEFKLELEWKFEVVKLIDAVDCVGSGSLRIDDDGTRRTIRGFGHYRNPLVGHTHIETDAVLTGDVKGIVVQVDLVERGSGRSSAYSSLQRATSWHF